MPSVGVETRRPVGLRRRKIGGLTLARWREAIQGYIFILPWVIGFLAFTAIPMFSSLYYSFTQYNVLSPPVFIGPENYRFAFFTDHLFWLSIRRTVTWMIFTIPIGIIGSLFAAILLNQALKGTTVWRTCFFLPSLTPAVAAAVLWVILLTPQTGIVNTYLRRAGLPAPGWLSSVGWALPSLTLIAFWTGIGGTRMLIFLAALQGVPQELYESAEIDGAGSIQKFLHITLPMVSPAMFFNVVMGIIGAFRVFGMAYVATAGGPAFATWFYALHLYRMAFNSFDMGYASALAWILFVITMIVTAFQFKFAGRWVYYEGGGR